MTQATMNDSMQWSDDYLLNNSTMDDTHREFVDLLNAVLAAPEHELLRHWEALVDHTQEHFDREDRWMLRTGFTADNCHASQHAIILKIMREGTQRGRSGELHVPRQMARELTVWFPQHAQAMDAALAMHLHELGFDPATGSIARPQALPMQAIEGCGGATCTDSEHK
ncbi:hemerythrin domain-containing protein [Curvibacter sp. APW13]|uniref:hemerythrin domain-containing protein n=1 Tax=Curvibacter sp. APW13 TaxID=3077236 RepID=UPI0028DEF44F|nr:hemerythrin domain-containing protein [Curvibacter sp. APW13]MDT8991874.1 hemerythrin domain-containing protein [Curvibacter sp. APW13]